MKLKSGMRVVSLGLYGASAIFKQSQRLPSARSLGLFMGKSKNSQEDTISSGHLKQSPK